jgi:hypothetical protein
LVVDPWVLYLSTAASTRYAVLGSIRGVPRVVPTRAAAKMRAAGIAYSSARTVGDGRLDALPVVTYVITLAVVLILLYALL